MTTYYLKSQLTEKLGTDANLAEQIELTPQTAKTYSGSNYYRQAASATGTGTDIAFLPPASTRFDYLSVKNTGTNDLFIIFANKITDLSLTVSGSTVTDTTSAGSGAVPAGKLPSQTPTMRESKNSHGMKILKTRLFVLGVVHTQLYLRLHQALAIVLFFVAPKALAVHLQQMLVFGAVYLFQQEQL